jgi:hypothetical protein
MKKNVVKVAGMLLSLGVGGGALGLDPKIPSIEIAVIPEDLYNEYTTGMVKAVTEVDRRIGDVDFAADPDQLVAKPRIRIECLKEDGVILKECCNCLLNTADIRISDILTRLVPYRISIHASSIQDYYYMRLRIIDECKPEDENKSVYVKTFKVFKNVYPIYTQNWPLM